MHLLLNKDFLSFIQRLGVLITLSVFLFHHPDDKGAWGFFGACVMDLFHAAKNGNGNGYTNGTK